MKTALCKFAAVIVSGVLMAASGATAATANPIVPPSPPSLDVQIDTQGLEDGTLILQSPGEAPYVVPEIDDAGLLPTASTDEDTTGTRAIADKVLNVQCAIPGATNRVIDKYPSKSHGTISFHCGNTSFGYLHIKVRHPESQWRAQMGGPGSWTAYMRYLQRSALKAPKTMSNQPNGKACYSTPVQVYRLVNGKAQYWKTINPSVIISTNNKKIITSIPSTRSAC